MKNSLTRIVWGAVYASFLLVRFAYAMEQGRPENLVETSYFTGLLCIPKKQSMCAHVMWVVKEHAFLP